MINDATYQSFVDNHRLSGNHAIVWWKDDIWLDDANNFNLDIDAVTAIPPQKPTLLKKH